MRNAGRIVGNSTDQTASILMCNGLALFCRKSHALRDVAKGMLVKKEFRAIPVKVFQYPYPFRSRSRVHGSKVQGWFFAEA